MTTTIEYALMAGASYVDTRDPINRFPIPQGWTDLLRHEAQPSGFEAVAFQNGTNIVISYAGTYDKSLPDFAADVSLAEGYGATQLLQAADYYLSIKNDPRYQGCNITLTGHSLGGGLAALVGVFFHVTATTFDQAPFANSAQSNSLLSNPLNILTPDVAANLKTDLLAMGYSETDLSALSNFLLIRPTDDSIPNANLVTNINVQGEFLSSAPATLFDRIGTTTDEILNSSTGVSGFDLHSQSLLTTFLQSDATATTNAAGQKQSLSQVTFKLTDLLGMIFDKKLFANDTDTDKRNLLDHLVRHEAGVFDPATGTISIPADAMVTRFTADLWKLAQDSGMTLNESNGQYYNWNNVSKALIAFAMQKYYEENNPNVSYGTELFTDLGSAGLGSNGITFDIANVSQTLNTKIQSGNVKYADLVTDIKGFGQYFQNYIETTGLLSSVERTLIKSMLPQLRDWYVQAGASGMTATDTLNRGAFMLGGNGADTLTGGSKADLLVGNAGDDVLNGGQGSDTLLGGVGVDTYVLNSGAGQGIDTILDSDNTGHLRDDTSSPIVLAGGDQYGDNRVFSGKDANGNSHLYTFVSGDRASGGDLLVDGAMLIKGYSPTTGNHMGITFADAMVQANPATTRDISGDFTPSDPDPAHQQPDGAAHAWTDALGNLLVTAAAAPGRADTLYDSGGNDHIIGGGDDHIFATRGGDDLIEAGAGRDDVNGGSGGDIMAGGDGDDRMYADSQISAAAAITLGNVPNSGSGLKGDWLAGGAGDDTLVGSTANDVLSGGAGADLLIAGAGDDDIMGDTDWVATNFNWTVTDQADGTRYFYPTNSNAQPTAGAADVIYAGDGADHVWGDLGNDVLFGEGGADKLQGGSGNDIILGGAGADWLYGEGRPADTAGSDYLDGGAGVDVIFGGAGNDIIVGGTENDTLYGEAGQDTYIFNQGDGNDTVYDLKADNNIFRFGAGISSNDITLRLGSLMLDLGNGDEIHLKNVEQRAPTQLELDAGIYQPGDVIDVLTDFDRNDVFNSSSISGFEFTDGTILSTAELLARGFDLDGTAGDDRMRWRNCAAIANGSKAANEEATYAWRIAA